MMKLKELLSVFMLFAIGISACSTHVVDAEDMANLTGAETSSMSSDSGDAEIALEDPEFSMDETRNEVKDMVDRPDGWSEETHGNDAEPNYDVVFPQDAVNRIDITITSDNWETMLADMTQMMGEFGSGSQGNQPNFAGGNLPEPGRMPEGVPQNPEEGQEGGGFPPAGGRQPGGGLRSEPGEGFNMSGDDENPVWVTATIEFESQTWEHVGIRFKGNSSLRDTWSTGNLKIPFKFDFDQFEDDYPEIDDQRFYGFKQLSLANNFSDASYLREKVTADIFRDFGIPAAHTAFYEVYIDTGDGLEYFGLYTMVEMIEDTVIEEQFSDDNGNLYKPDGNGATFALGSFSEASFDKESNQEEEDYSDIQKVFDVLHAENRLSDPDAWRTDLESVFDVDIFLRWLAANTVVQNWDTYGVMSHNYFLYLNPETDLMTWIPWDNNMALTDSLGRGNPLSLSLAEVTEKWPLIRFLMDNSVYKAQYEAYLEEVVETAFEPEAMSDIYIFYHSLIAESVLKERDEATTLQSKSVFEDSLQELIKHVNDRYQSVQNYLSD